MRGNNSKKGSRVFLYVAAAPHVVLMLSCVVSMNVFCVLLFVLHVNLVWLSSVSVHVCVFMCVRLFSELSHRSLGCLAGFYADGLINEWEMLVLHYGCSPSCNARHDMTWHTHSLSAVHYTCSHNKQRRKKT